MEAPDEAIARIRAYMYERFAATTPLVRGMGSRRILSPQELRAQNVGLGAFLDREELKKEMEKGLVSLNHQKCGWDVPPDVREDMDRAICEMVETIFFYRGKK